MARLTNQRVADAWVSGIRATSGNLYTDGETIWSYGRHFPIAKHLADGRVLYNITHYSNTTAKHQALVSSAMRGVGKTAIECRSIVPCDNERYTLATLRKLIAAIPNCRLLESRLADVKHELSRYVECNEALGVKNPSWVGVLQFATSSLRGKALRAWAKNYKIT